jgi:hypothetical protein
MPQIAPITLGKYLLLHSAIIIFKASLILGLHKSLYVHALTLQLFLDAEEAYKCNN